MRWNEVSLDLLSMIVGARNISLECVVRPTDNICYDETFELMNNTCYAEDFGSLEEETNKR